jgi:TonB family protein
MKILPLIVFSLLLAACASSPTPPRIVTFTGDYIDARKDPAAKPVSLHKAPLQVPAYLRERDLAASAVVAFMVEADGSTSEVQIVSTDDQEFAEAVRESVLGWRYAPLVQNGTPVRVVIEESFGWRSNRILPIQP